MNVRLIAFAAIILATTSLCADPIPVVNAQGVTRGFLLIRSETGAILAHGEYVQFLKGDHIWSRLLYNFRDGSIDDDVTIFTQHGTLRLVSDHHIQHGPSFPDPLDMLVEAETGQVTIRSRDKDGKKTVETNHFDLPPDIADGIVGTILVNIKHDAPPFKLSYIANIGKGRLVHLDVIPDGQASFSIAGLRHTADVFRIKIELGGVVGVVAPILGKEPDDTFVWVLPGTPPVFMREITPLTDSGGPMISVEPAGTSFPALQQAKKGIKPAHSPAISAAATANPAAAAKPR